MENVKEEFTEKKENNFKTEISEFFVQSNCPQKEYVRYLEHEIKTWLIKKNNTKDPQIRQLINEKISSIDSLKQEILAESFYYYIMDMIFVGEKELAKNMCTKDILEYCEFCLGNPSGKIKDIYVYFANKFNMQRKDC